MTTIQSLRVEYLNEKHPDYGNEKVELLVQTGLTFAPEKLRSDKTEDKKNLQWYYPKGAAFSSSKESGSDSGEVTHTPNPAPVNNTEDEINNPDNTVTVTTTDEQGNQTTEPLDPNSSVEPITAQDGTQMGDSEGNVLVGGDENTNQTNNTNPEDPTNDNVH